MAAERSIDLTLAQYAAMLAGLAEGHELARVLAHEGIDPATWPDAAEAWAGRLAEAASDLQAQFDEHLGAAQDRYGRRLRPLDEDLRAFLDFRRRWSTDPDPPALLARLGVRLGEVARLSRLWSTRLAADPALAEQAQAILPEEPGEMPAITPVAVELPPVPAGAIPVSASLPNEHEDDDEPDETTAAPPPFAPLPSWGKTEQPRGPEPRKQDEAALPAAAAQITSTGRAEVPKKPPRPSFLLTGAFVAPVPHAVTPSQPGGASRPDGGAVPPASLPPVKRTPAPLSATAAFAGPLRAPALPFSKKNEPQGTAPASEQKAPPTVPEPVPAGPGQPARDALTGTASFDASSLAAALPFARASNAASPLPQKSPTKLTLGQYAALCAELAAFPTEIAETFQRYGLGSQQDGFELASAWQKRFQQAPMEFETWQRLKHFYLEHCRTKGRPEVKP